LECGRVEGNNRGQPGRIHCPKCGAVV
jgi:hypothetical protein